MNHHRTRRHRGGMLMPLALLLAAALLMAGCTDASEDDSAAADEPSSADDAASRDSEADFTAVDDAVAAYVADEDLNGAGLVIVDGEQGVVHEYYTGEFGPDRISLIASASKMLTAGVLMRLEDQGLLDMDAPVADAVEWGAGNPDITPAQLVSNSSGLVGLVDNPTFPPYLCQYIASGDLEACGEQIFTTTEDDPQVVPPDTKFRYGGGQWQAAGALAEAVSGKSWAELIEETYVEPCGLETLGYNNHFAQMTSGDGPFSYPTQFDGDPSTLKPTDNPNMEGGAYVSPTDYAKLVQMHLNGGECENGRVLSEEAVDRMHTDRVNATYGATLGSGFGGYGLGWWVGADEPTYVEDGGAFGAVPWLDLDKGYGAYLVIEDRSTVGRELANQIRPLVAEQIDVLQEN